jgi:16S rRNA (cytidine1402-2'-O)-methyltransferase
VALYESPHRILDALADIQNVLGERPLSVSREISKMHEETIRGTAEHVASVLAAKPSIKGEFVIIIGAQNKSPETLTDEDITKAIETALLDHTSGKAASLVSKKLGLPRDDIYARILTLKGKA